MDYNDAIKSLGQGLTSKADRLKAMEENRRKNQAEMLAKQNSMVSSMPGMNQLAVSPVITQLVPTIITPAQLTLEDLQKELFKRKEELNKKVNDMILDADAYRVNIPAIRLLTEDKTPAERLKYSGNIAVALNVPIIIVMVYIGEMYGFFEELDKNIKILMDFYTVNEILNIKR